MMPSHPSSVPPSFPFEPTPAEMKIFRGTLQPICLAIRLRKQISPGVPCWEKERVEAWWQPEEEPGRPHLVGETGIMNWRWTGPNGDKNCSVIHNPCPLFKLKPCVRILNLNLGVTGTPFFFFLIRPHWRSLYLLFIIPCFFDWSAGEGWLSCRASLRP